jgi:hypothetical protein
MQPKKISISLTCGLISGLAMVLLTTILYLGGVNAFLGPVAYWGYVTPLAMAIIAPLAEKKARGGYLEFRDALKASFLVFVITLALQTLFTWVLMNYIDPPFRQAVEQVTQARTEKLLHDMMHMDQEKIDEAMAREQGVNHFTLPKLLMGLAFWYVVFFIVSLLIAAIVRKKKPEFSESDFK